MEALFLPNVTRVRQYMGSGVPLCNHYAYCWCRRPLSRQQPYRITARLRTDVIGANLKIIHAFRRRVFAHLPRAGRLCIMKLKFHGPHLVAHERAFLRPGKATGKATRKDNVEAN